MFPRLSFLTPFLPYPHISPLGPLSPLLSFFYHFILPLLTPLPSSNFFSVLQLSSIVYSFPLFFSVLSSSFSVIFPSSVFCPPLCHSFPRIPCFLSCRLLSVQPSILRRLSCPSLLLWKDARNQCFTDAFASILNIDLLLNSQHCQGIL